MQVVSLQVLAVLSDEDLHELGINTPALCKQFHEGLETLQASIAHASKVLDPGPVVQEGRGDIVVTTCGDAEGGE